jgi:hypothetical protein
VEGNRPNSPSPPISSAEPQLPVLRFGLKQFFWWITGTCLLLALFAAIPTGLALLAVVLAVGVIALHVLSTALGTQLRDHANQHRIWESAEIGPSDVAIPSQPAIVPPFRRSPLHGRDQPLRRLRIWLTAGATLGGLLGIAALSLLLGNRTSIAGILVGSASTAVVGAWIAFVISSAWSIFRQGWRDAVRDPSEPATRSAK